MSRLNSTALNTTYSYKNEMTIVYRMLGGCYGSLFHDNTDEVFLTVNLKYFPSTDELSIVAHAYSLKQLDMKETKLKVNAEYHIYNKKTIICSDDEIPLNRVDSKRREWKHVLSQIERYVEKDLMSALFSDLEIKDVFTFEAVVLVGHVTRYDLLCTVDFCKHANLYVMDMFANITIPLEKSCHVAHGTIHDVHLYTDYTLIKTLVQTNEMWNLSISRAILRMKPSVNFQIKHHTTPSIYWRLSISEYLTGADYPIVKDLISCLKDMIRNLPRERIDDFSVTNCVMTYPAFNFVQWSGIIIKDT